MPSRQNKTEIIPKCIIDIVFKRLVWRGRMSNCNWIWYHCRATPNGRLHPSYTMRGDQQTRNEILCIHLGEIPLFLPIILCTLTHLLEVRYLATSEPHNRSVSIRSFSWIIDPTSTYYKAVTQLPDYGHLLDQQWEKPQGKFLVFVLWLEKHAFIQNGVCKSRTRWSQIGIIDEFWQE